MKDILIVARSGRALATSAYEAGYTVHVLDFFADEDTKSFAKTTHQLQPHPEGFDKIELMQQVKKLVSCYPKAVLVVGTGFEKTPELLENLVEIIPVFSNDKKTVHNLKDPVYLYNMLRFASIKTPEISFECPINSDGWLLKEIAGTGGGHVKWLSQINPSSCSGYYQEHISGSILSAVFLANCTHAILVGISEQLQSKQFNSMPFLLGGVVRQSSDYQQQRQSIIEIINKITKQTGLKGLCGIDYIVTNSGLIFVLEVNPRPPSSFELYEKQSILFDAHLACFENKKFDFKLEQTNQVKGYAVYYAKQNIKINSNIAWPSWVKDRPCIGSAIAKKDPVCTVHVKDESIIDVKALLQKRLVDIETIIITEQDAT